VHVVQLPSREIEHLLIVVAGRVACSTREETVELGVGEAVEWQEGEWHETRSLEQS
jgi:mannose-6-phosphate isomerase-like protein (cupin superfamily)